MVGGAEHLTGPRGSDLRFEDASRPTREQKRAEQQARRDAKAATRAEMEAEYSHSGSRISAAEDDSEDSDPAEPVEIVYPHGDPEVELRIDDSDQDRSGGDATDEEHLR